MLQKSCKMLLALTLAITLWGSANAQVPTYIENSGCFGLKIGGRCGPQGCNPQPRYQPGPPRPAQPVRQATPTRQPAGKRHPSEIQVRAVCPRAMQYGTGSFVLFEGKQYIVTCAHIFEPGWTAEVKLNNQWVKTVILKGAAIADIAILKAPANHPTPLILAPTFASPGTRITQAGRAGTVIGYEGGNIQIKCLAQEGDSGGPIYSVKGIVGIVAEYSPTDLGGCTIGPNVTLISDLLKSLLVSPPVNKRPLVPVDPPAMPKAKIDTSLLARISSLEQRMKEFPRCDGIGTNKTAITIHTKKIESLEMDLREVRSQLQLVLGAVETVQREVITHNKNLEYITAKNRDAIVRIQRLEQSTTALSKTMKGKMQFRLKIDQSGRVTGVDRQ